MRFELQRTGNDAVIVAGGRLTCSHAGRIRQQFLEALTGASRVDLFLHEVLEADLTFLQLLCSGHRTAAAQGTVFTIGGLDADNPVRSLIGRAGAGRGVGCPADCLWAAAFDAAHSADPPAPDQRPES
ncbi:MAG: STAS domain-containing protein [Candidatus Methylomirabilia bacterium]